MSTVVSPARPAHPVPPRPGEWIATDLAPVAAEIAGTLRDYDLADVHTILSRVPAGRQLDLMLVLAAMVDPDKTPGELLAWTGALAVSRDAAEDEDEPSLPPSRQRATCGLCGQSLRRDKLPQHNRRRHSGTAVQAA